jgi:hypothetical protein
LFIGDQEVGRLARHILAVVVLGERQREGLAFAGLHAPHGVFELLEHLTVADDELEVLPPCRLRTVRRRSCLRKSTVTRSLSCGGLVMAARWAKVRRCLRRMSTVLVDGSVGHLGRQLLDLGGGQITDLAPPG